MTAERIAKAPKLKLAITAGIGSDHVDLDATISHGITVVEETYSNSISVTEHAVPEIERELGLTVHPDAASLVRTVDVVPINAPLHPQTHHLFDDALISSMKRGSYIVNTARAEITDRDAIVRALESGQIAGYAGDVWYPQPPAADHPWRTMSHNGMTRHVFGSTLSAQTARAPM